MQYARSWLLVLILPVMALLVLARYCWQAWRGATLRLPMRRFTRLSPMVIRGAPTTSSNSGARRVAPRKEYSRVSPTACGDDYRDGAGLGPAGAARRWMPCMGYTGPVSAEVLVVDRHRLQVLAHALRSQPCVVGANRLVDAGML